MTEGADETTTSPKNRLKFLCSHGGKILPRPNDGRLKYVGGETRVVAVPRDVTFSELMQKLTGLFDGDFVLKYQIIPEDLDALVSVRSDEDLRHMLDEYDRQESGGTSKLRAFLYPSKPIVENRNSTTAESQVLEQRYVDAINGIVCAGNPRRMSVNTSGPAFNISSACSSPRSSLSPNSPPVEPITQEPVPLVGSYRGNRMAPMPRMPRVHSSPTLCSLNSSSSSNNPQHNPSNHHTHPHHHPIYQNQRQYHCPHPFGFQGWRLPEPYQGGGWRGERMNQLPQFVGRPDVGRIQSGQGLKHYKLHRLGSEGHRDCAHLECSGAYGCATRDRAGSVPQSPRRVIWE